MSELSGKWTFNLQTLVLIGGIAATLIAWGYTLSNLQSDTNHNSDSVNKLTLRLERNDSATAQLDQRVAALEKIAGDAIMLRRELDGTIAQFKSDIAVIKEILERMDRNKEPKP